MRNTYLHAQYDVKRTRPLWSLRNTQKSGIITEYYCRQQTREKNDTKNDRLHKTRSMTENVHTKNDDMEMVTWWQRTMTTKKNNNNDMTTVNNTEYDDNRKRCWQRTDGRKWWYDDRGRWRQKVTQRMMTTQQKLMTLWRRIIEHCDRKWCFFLKGAWPSLQELLWPKIDR